MAGAVLLNACDDLGLPMSPNDLQPSDELGDPISPLEQVRSFGNYYEFSRSRTEVRELAKDLVTVPWDIEVSGLVKHPRTYSVEELVKFTPREHIYRFRCLEAWSFVIPWFGFPLKRLLEEVSPEPEAKFVRFESLYDPGQLPAQNAHRFNEWLASGKRGDQANMGIMGIGLEDAPYSWPYSEGLYIEEAMHDLTLIATGMYGRPLYPENGAPLRLVVPWKYSFKSIKAITKIELVADQPATFWNAAIPDEFGFYGNVNPDVDHPRWSQARELRLTGLQEGEVFPTLPFNGYASQVADLYKGVDLVHNF